MRFLVSMCRVTVIPACILLCLGQRVSVSAKGIEGVDQISDNAIFQLDVAWQPEGRASKELARENISQFGQDAILRLLADLGLQVQTQREENLDRRIPDQSKRAKELPQLTRMADLNDQPLIYHGIEIEQVKRECEDALLVIRSEKERNLLHSIHAAALKALQLRGEIILYRYPPPPAPGGLQLIYTIRVTSSASSNARYGSLGQFDTRSLYTFWDDLSVGAQQWEQWRNRLQNGKYIPIVTEFPQLSTLAVVDEGTVAYKTDSLPLLLGECERALLVVHNERARKLLQNLILASTTAIKTNSEIAIFSSGVGKLGDIHDK